ncbi:MAG: ABC transporter substrate-binding protein [Bauldia sp.]
MDNDTTRSADLFLPLVPAPAPACTTSMPPVFFGGSVVGGRVGIDRRQFLTAATAIVVLPSVARAQRRMPFVAVMIGALPPPDPSGVAWADAVVEGLRGQGWRVGENVTIEFRFTAGEQSLTLRYSSELVAMEPDVFVTGTPMNALAVRALTTAIPLVFVAVGDPIGDGLVRSYPEPGGNTTGITHLENSVGGRMVDILMEIAPSTRVVGYLTNPDTSPLPMLPFVEESAAGHGVGVVVIDVRSTGEVLPALTEFARRKHPGLVLAPNNWVHNNGSAFVDAINALGIPAVYPAHRMVVAGGLIGVGTYTTELFRVGGEYAGMILNGHAPRDLPVQVAPFSVMLNLRTAAASGLAIPSTLYAIVEQFIE